MHGLRVAFDPNAEFYVTRQGGMQLGDRRFRQGETFTWRELGLSIDDLLLFWRGLDLDCRLPEVAVAVATPAETPRGKRHRAHRR